MEMSTIGALVTIGVMLFILLLVNIDLMRIDRARDQKKRLEHEHHVPPFLVGLPDVGLRPEVEE